MRTIAQVVGHIRNVVSDWPWLGRADPKGEEGARRVTEAAAARRREEEAQQRRTEEVLSGELRVVEAEFGHTLALRKAQISAQDLRRKEIRWYGRTLHNLRLWRDEPLNNYRQTIERCDRELPELEKRLAELRCTSLYLI